MGFLTLNDRCDACQAAAKALITLTDGSQLLMCMHHTNKNKKALEAIKAVIIIDDFQDNNDV